MMKLVINWQTGKKNAHICLNVRQVYKGEIEEKLLNQLCTDSTVAIIYSTRMKVNIGKVNLR